MGLGELIHKLPDMEMVEAVASSQQNGKKVLNLLTEDDAAAYVSLKCILFLAIHDLVANDERMHHYQRRRTSITGLVL